jgi:hypothetical protein
LKNELALEKRVLELTKAEMYSDVDDKYLHHQDHSDVDERTLIKGVYHRDKSPRKRLTSLSHRVLNDDNEDEVKDKGKNGDDDDDDDGGDNDNYGGDNDNDGGDDDSGNDDNNDDGQVRHKGNND